MIADTVIIRGRAEIAHRLGRHPSTVTRYVRRGLLPATHDGPFANNLLCARLADIERLRAPADSEDPD